MTILSTVEHVRSAALSLAAAEILTEINECSGDLVEVLVDRRLNDHSIEAYTVKFERVNHVKVEGCLDKYRADSDWDYYGYEEYDLEVVAAERFDEDENELYEIEVDAIPADLLEKAEEAARNKLS